MNCLKPKVSIIVPVYNTGILLEKCIKSLLNQTLKEIEVIIINDGSTDNSIDICNKMANIDKRVIVINKRNEGVSKARNIAINIANGEYIGFVDSDDYVENNMYEELYKASVVNKCDISMCDCKIESNHREIIDSIDIISESKIFYKDDIFPDELALMAGSMCKCIYSTDLLRNNNILCPIEIKLSEDRIFNIKALGRMKKLYYLKRPLYNIVIRQNSATMIFRRDMLNLILNSREYMLNVIKEEWNNDRGYIDRYELLNLSGIYQCINNAMKSNTLKESYISIKKIITNIEVQELIKNIKTKNIRIFLVKYKMYNLIFLLMLIKKSKFIMRIRGKDNV